ncbi:MAG: hypothetical protein BWK76_12360 [Desulfobulbaceae bacterium A2]|nr:MAG: hypothetical protein BWK76_12360 [Desulfobulbaceae bacterium A2]
MSLGAERRALDLEQIRELLLKYPQIELLKTDGDPPDRYEFAYFLLGPSIDDAGKPSMVESHRILISLPFGYPHLPPACKPLTPIFHPCFDPDAVQIADFWSHERTLADLILHLGRMICGQQVVTEDPFNSEAAAWYEEHAAELPWDHLIAKPEAIDDDMVESPADITLFTEEEGDAPAKASRAGPEELRKAIAERRYYAAYKLLTSLAEDERLQDYEVLAELIDSQIRLAEQRRLAARTHEQLGKPAVGMRLLEQVATQVTDAPGLAEEIQRLRKQSVPIPPPRRRGLHHDPASRIKRLIPAAPDRSKTLLVISTILVLLLAGGAGVVLYDLFHQRGAATAWKQAQDNMQRHRFDDARDDAERGADLLRRLLLPPRQNARQLSQAIDALLNSRKLAEGLKGNIAYQGVFLPQETIKALEEGQAKIARAEALAANNRWQEAADLYDEALRSLLAAGGNTGEREQELRLRLARTKLQTLLQGAQNAGASTNRQEAARQFREANELAQSLDDAVDQADMESRVTQVELRHLLERGRQAMQDNNWPAAADSFRRGIALIDATGVVPAMREELHRGLQRSRIGQLMAEAKLASDQLKWETASKRYDEALSILHDNPFLKELVEGADTLRKTRLLANIAWTRQLVDEAIRRKNTTEELKQLRRILAELDHSDLHQDEQLRLLRKEFADRVAAREREEEIARLTRYLLEHFDEIFLENYPSTRTSKLMQPKVTFTGQDEYLMRFNLKCVELNQGRPFRLELNYLYDTEMDVWRLAPAQQTN